MTPADLEWATLFRRRLTRRDLLRVGGSAAALAAAGCLPARRGDPAPRFASDPFRLGVASGDPAPDGVVLWARLSPEALLEAGAARSRVAVRWEVAHDEGFRSVARRGEALALPELGHSVHAEVEGLEAGRGYFYRFLSGGAESPVGRTRTAPGAGASPSELRFAFASCQNWEHGYYTAFRHLSEEDLHFVLHLGDYIYEKRFGDNNVREHEAGEVFTLDEYRARYALYRSDPDLQAAHAAFPWIVTTDDHEVDNNYAGAVPEDDQDPAAFLLRRAAAYQAYYEFMPLRRSSMPAGPDMALYRGVRFGDLAELFVLDTRQYRSDQACGDGQKVPCVEWSAPERVFLGDEQEAWLQDGLRRSRGRWNALGNQVLMAQLLGVDERGERTVRMDNWNGYPVARRRLLDFLARERPSNPVVLTGDIHSSWVADLRRDFDDPDTPAVATEFVGTSITSGGDGRETFGGFEESRTLNPHIRFFNGRRGYVRVRLTPELWTTDYRVVPFVSRPGAPVETRATFVVEDGRAGAEEG